MTIRVALLPYGPSDSCVALRNAIREQINSGNLDATITLLRSEGSRYTPRQSDVIINYGNRRYSENFFGRARVLNNLQALNRAANKLQALNTLSQAGIPTVEYTTQQQIAQGWVAEGGTVYARGVLNGHSGEGITVHDSNNSTVPAAPLYTKGITSQRREWRVHVFEGKITYVQLKKRRDGWREDPNYREDVRNHHTGWIYSTSPANVIPSDAVLRAAYDAVTALGLNFGAVDIISRQNQAWVLEVNTAPGLTGTTLETYQHNFSEFVKSLASGENPSYRVAYPVPEPTTRAVAEPEPVEEVVEAVTPQQATVSTPPTQVDLSEHREAATDHMAVSGDLETGMYLADLLNNNTSSDLAAQNVIVYVSNNCVFRHGWNLPIPRQFVRNLRQIGSVTLSTNETIAL